MIRDEAKFILRACRPGGQDAGDQQFREALEMLQHDPVLAEWFASEQALDARLSEAFRAYPVPPDLKAQLLAARKVVPLRARWQRPIWLAAAACLVLAGVLAVTLLRPAASPQFANFRVYVAEFTTRLDHLDYTGRDVTELKQWLRNRGALGDFAIPTGLNGRSAIGCRIVPWQGKKISLVCFNLENGHEAHLFVIDRAALPDTPAGTEPQFATLAHGIATASWSNGQCVYVLASDAGEQELRRLL